MHFNRPVPRPPSFRGTAAPLCSGERLGLVTARLRDQHQSEDSAPRPLSPVSCLARPLRNWQWPLSGDSGPTVTVRVTVAVRRIQALLGSGVLVKD